MVIESEGVWFYRVTEDAMKYVSSASAKVRIFLADETGGEVIEYALILGLIIVVCITAVGAYGTKVLARWTSVNSSM